MQLIHLKKADLLQLVPYLFDFLYFNPLFFKYHLLITNQSDIFAPRFKEIVLINTCKLWIH